MLHVFNKTIAALLFAALPFFAAAQATEGKIIFDETIKLEIQLPDDAPEEMKKMLPSEQKHQQILLFNGNTTLYRELDENDSKDLNIKHEDPDGGEFRINMMRPKNELYRDLQNDRAVESREFMGRTFLVKDEPKARKWKLTGEKKAILGHNCQKAQLVDSTKQIVAWFTTDIPVSAGPETFHGLPGMILEVDTDNGKRTYVASKIELSAPEKDDLKAPTKGKECTRAEYEKIMADKLKEMGIDGGPGGAKIMIRH